MLPDGTTLYVPRTLPGERVRARALGKRGEGAAGTLDAIVEPSAERVTPPCAHFGACGGCALQHWRTDAYLAWKSGLLEAALRRAGYAPSLAPIVAVGEGARRRMDFAARRQRGTLLLGLHAPRGGEVIDLHECYVLHPRLFALVAPLRAVLRGLAALRREASVFANLLDSGTDLLLRTDAALTTQDRVALAAFAREHGVARIAWARGTGATETACELRPATIALGGMTVAPPPGAFLQAAGAGEAAIVAAVLAGLPERLAPRARIAELYAGCGTLTFALAAHAPVEAFEGDAAASAALAAAANRAGLSGRITARQRDLVRQPLLAADLGRFAAVVLDPPHAGAVAQIAHIATSKAARVIYVSCNPATLARDAAVLRGVGFALRAATPIDQFLWSSRLESVCVFAR
jgi:23S rRNA (uracil1939-C5)-methyltransferase